VREHATRVVSTSVQEGHDRVTLERVFDAPGVTRFVQRISLLADDPVVHLEVELELETNPNPQGFYLAIPLALEPGWQAAYDSAGDLIRLDDDQLPGACRGWVTAESMSEMWDDDTAVALFVPDAPSVQFGDFHFGPPLSSVPRPKDPLLLAWPVNNYWSTNFPQVQPGRITLRYGFMSVPAAERDQLRQHAALFRQPPLVWPITSGGRGAGSGLLPGLQ
jgi:alpha-mannosidase